MRHAWHFQSPHSLMAHIFRKLFFPTALRAAFEPLVHRDHFFGALRSPRRDWRAGNNAIAAVHPPGHMSSTRRSRDKNTTPRNQPKTHTHRGVTIMNTKTKLALAAALFVGTTSFAAAQGYDPNLANRYPALPNPAAAATQASARQNRTLRSAPVGLYQGRNVQLNNQRSYGTSEDPIAVNAHDHAYSPSAGG